MIWDQMFDSTIPRLNYTPEQTDSTNIIENQTYADRSSALLEVYSNHQLEFNQSYGERIIVPLDLFFAKQYLVSSTNIPLTFIGILALRLCRYPKGK